MFQKLKSLITKKNYNDLSNINGNNTFYPILNSEYTPASFTRTDYLSLYRGWIYTAITTRANAISELNFQLKPSKDSNDTIESELLKLITPELLDQIVSFMDLNGSCYVWKNAFGNTIESLNVLRPDLVTLEKNDDGTLKGYRYSYQNKNFFFPKEEVMSFNNFNPLEAYPYKTKGFSPVQAVAVQAESDNASVKWNWQYFKNGASVKEILKTDKTLTDETKERVANKWNNKYQGMNNAGKIAILDNSLDYQSISPSQKEMDFVESRKFTRDEILAIFKVPKALIGQGEAVNVGNVDAFERIFAKRVVNPLANLIASVFNQELFDGTGYFEFINIIPLDKEELRKDLEAGTITINEYRNKIGYNALKGGDVLKLNPLFITDEVSEKKFNKKTELGEKITCILKSNTKGTDEYNKKKEQVNQKKWEVKIARNNNYEIKYIEEINKIFDLQENDVLNQINTQKSIKIVKKPKFDTLKYLIFWQSFLGPEQKELVQNEGNLALGDVGVSGFFRIGDKETNKWLKDNINKFAKEVDLLTKEKILDTIAKGNEEGLGADEIAKNVSSQFAGFKKNRSLKIARTETIRAGNFASQKAWEDSEVVESKEWFTAQDERVCPNCGPMHGKTIGLSKNFFDKGQTAPGGLALNYEDVKSAPLHPQCRCSIIPIIKD